MAMNSLVSCRSFPRCLETVKTRPERVNTCKAPVPLDGQTLLAISILSRAIFEISDPVQSSPVACGKLPQFPSLVPYNPA